MALIKCFECGNQVSDTATTCPKCGAPLSTKSDKIKANTNMSNQQKKANKSHVEMKHHEASSVIGFGVLILILIVILIRSCSGGSDETKPAQLSLPENYNAHFIAKQTIKSMLSDPKDAEFPSITDIQITNLGNGTWTVLGYVNAKNGFNATQRVKYKVEMHAKDQCNDYNSLTCWDDIKPYM
ncbi:MAG: zinc-ribbon domain-containing protein [Sulfuricurvum sp.]|nr:zinc-ribbon domain-containing protein [Sulfuricurvum sp.]